MRAKKSLKRHPGIITLMAFLAVMVIIPFGGYTLKANAAELTADLTVKWKDAGMDLALYQVAVRNDDGTFTLTDGFKDYGVDIENINDNTAETLAAYAMRDDLTPYRDVITTDDSGSYTFGDLDLGAYLVFDQSTVNGDDVTAVPVFVFLQKDMEVDIKPENAEKSTSYKVYKVWDDDDDEEGDRPDTIKVQLLKDGSVYEEVTLSDDNNWTYTWSDLPEATYKAVEKSVPSGYKLSVSRSNNTCKLTNKYKKSSSTTSTDDDDDDDDDDDNPPKNTSTSKKIPQTGQLWWPVPILFSAGFLCMIIGLLRRNKENRKKED